MPLTTPRFGVAVANQELPRSEEFLHDGIKCAKTKCRCQRPEQAKCSAVKGEIEKELW